MAVLGVGKIKFITNGSTDPTKVDITITMMGIKSGQLVNAYDIVMTDQDPTLASVTWTGNIKARIQSILTNTFGYTFTPLVDGIALISESIV